MSENKIYFKFDGKTYGGNQGDTIASALLRNEVKIVGRSFKYHRPRGIYTCGIEEPNALVQIINEHNEPNVRATVKKIYDGMVVKSQTVGHRLKGTLDQSIIFCHQYSLLVFIIKPLWVPRVFGKTFMNL